LSGQLDKNLLAFINPYNLTIFMNAYLLGFLLSIITAPELVVFVLFESIAKSFWSAFLILIAISIGGTFGSTVIYLAARLVGHERCLELIKKHGRKILLKPSDMESIDYYYERCGGLIIFFGRWLPTFRSLVSIPAGLSRIAVWRFITLTLLGTFTWNFILCSMIYGFQTYLDYLEVGLEKYSMATFTAVLLLLAYFIIRRISERIIKGANDWNDGSEKK